MLIKASLSVYNPADPFEAALQDAFHRYNVGWMTSFECQLVAKAISSLKATDDWLNEEELYGIRANYFFDPEMCGDSSRAVFVTRPLFLRDILENKKISSYLNDPIVFLSKPLAYFLFKDYAVHLIVDLNIIGLSNAIHLGGLWIFEENLDIPVSSINGIKIHDDINRERLIQLINRIGLDSKLDIRKVAVTKKERGVFGLEHGIDLNIKAGDAVQNKVTKKRGIIYSVEPGDTGQISVLYNNGESALFTKNEFVKNFIYNFEKN